MLHVVFELGVSLYILRLEEGFLVCSVGIPPLQTEVLPDWASLFAALLEAGIEDAARIVDRLSALDPLPVIKAA